MPPFAFSPTAPTCLISCHLGTQSLSHRSRLPTFRRVQGRIGFMRFPGSEVVLDRPSKKLVLCDRDRCPYADRCVGISSHRCTHACTHDRSKPHILSGHLKARLLSYTAIRNAANQCGRRSDALCAVLPTRTVPRRSSTALLSSTCLHTTSTPSYHQTWLSLHTTCCHICARTQSVPCWR